MKIILFGLPQTGKSTVFRLITGQKPQEIRFDNQGSPMPQVGVANVPDERVDFIHTHFPESKAVYTQIEYTDLAGLKFGDVKENRLLAYLREADLLVHVVRSFENEAVFHDAGDINPVRDVLQMEDEMVLSDLILLESRLEKLEKTVMKVKDPKDALRLKTLMKLKPILEDGKPLRGIKLNEDEDKSIRGFGFTTLKPLQIVINIGEEQISERVKMTEELFEQLPNKDKVTVSRVCATVEHEISELSQEDAEVFMDEYGINELGRKRLIQNSYDLLGLISFLTIGKDECRSWAIKRGTPAVRAAGQVHTDIERGFIAAEVIKYADYEKLPNEQQLKKEGKVKIQGRDYIVEDGDLIDYRFNV